MSNWRRSSVPAAGFALFVVGLAVLARVGEADISEQAVSVLRGGIEIDGSSTVGPITQAVAEEFGKANPRVLIVVGVSGTGGGFKRFTTGETEISNASRPIKPSEVAQATAAGIEFAEIPVAYDGLSIIVNPRNRFVDCLTTEELRLIWRPGSTVTRWSDIRPEWPDTKLRLYGPGTASGTFEYFTEAIMGESGASRPDYTASEDDNVLVQGIAGDRQALGYFGYAFYAENKNLLSAVAVDSGDGCVIPSEESISNGTYSPLSRPLYIYVNRTHLQRPEVLGFLDFYISSAHELVPEVGYVPLTDVEYKAAQGLLE